MNTTNQIGSVPAAGLERKVIELIKLIWKENHQLFIVVIVVVVLLFQEARDPQYPVTCLYDHQSSYKKNLRHRHLLDNGASKAIDLKSATEACAYYNVAGDLRHFCIEDVMVTGDVELASDPFYSNYY